MTMISHENTERSVARDLPAPAAALAGMEVGWSQTPERLAELPASHSGGSR